MARDAIWIDETGNAKLVYAKELTDADIGKRYLCSGTADDGCLCGIRMSLSRESELACRRFYPETRDQRHKEGCPNAREGKKTIVHKLDQSGENITTQQLFDKMNRDKYIKPKKEAEPETEETPSEEVEIDESAGPKNGFPDVHISIDEDDYIKEIETKKRHPRTVAEYIELLTILPPQVKYADRLVYDQILDERTIDGYKRFGRIPTERPFVINASKAVPRDYGIGLNNNQWLLRDFRDWGSNAFLFVLNLDAKAKEKLRNLCEIKPAVKIGVWAIFHAHPTRPMTFESELIKEHMITAVVTGE